MKNFWKRFSNSVSLLLLGLVIVIIGWSIILKNVIGSNNWDILWRKTLCEIVYSGGHRVPDQSVIDSCSASNVDVFGTFIYFAIVFLILGAVSLIWYKFKSKNNNSR